MLSWAVKSPMTDEELRQCINYYQTDVRQKQAKARAMAFENNKKEGEAFLAENRKKEGVVTLPSGLQYRIIKAGDGKIPTDEDSVECNYRGTLINGTEFDSSYRRGQPAIFKVNWRHSRLAGGSQAHADRLHMADLCSFSACLRSAGNGRRHRTECNAYF